MNITKYLSEIGKKGGESTKKKHGKRYFVELSKQGVKAREKKRREIQRSQDEILKPIIK